jgi:hypothetical protein
LSHPDAWLYQALVFKDLEAVKYYCMKLNSGDMYSLLAAVLTNRSWDDIKDPSLGSLRTPNTKQDRTLIRTCESFSLTGCRREHLINPGGRLMWLVVILCRISLPMVQMRRSTCSRSPRSSTAYHDRSAS